MKRFALLAALAMSLALVAIACGGDDDDPPPGEETADGTSAGGQSSPSPGSPATTRTATAGPGSPTATNQPRSSPTQGAQNPVDVLRAFNVPDDMTSGPVLSTGTPKVTLAVWEDFQCPHCLRFTATVEPQIVEEYVKTGKVRLEFKQLPILGTESENAAVASTCAAFQDKFWPFHKELFLVQAEAGQLQNERINVGRFSDGALEGIANRVGLDVNQYKGCYASEATVEVILGDIRAASTLGFRGTPSFAINGKALASPPATMADWRKVLDEALK